MPSIASRSSPTSAPASSTSGRSASWPSNCPRRAATDQIHDENSDVMVGNRPGSVNHERSTRLWRMADFLGLERNVAAVSGVVFLLGMGEELWKKFLPKYLEALGAGPAIVGLFGTATDF